ncbi:hypothetical protein K505DRAFT_9150 [Melanomma pulvis-pyrius CBS 109.77]|uniref:Uncharacterized protein n=1 Tax=Melanomma pulvis-pyrius CBS 109.77 TaxID=1314802 RepID=A0A6A6XHI7_9PLEO|nr:hypothetical protein K505DRAFT_9150 [Melanomma pulvis-pyrius CBS 109.77]
MLVEQTGQIDGVGWPVRRLAMFAVVLTLRFSHPPHPSSPEHHPLRDGKLDRGNFESHDRGSNVVLTCILGPVCCSSSQRRSHAMQARPSLLETARLPELLQETRERQEFLSNSKIRPFFLPERSCCFSPSAQTAPTGRHGRRQGLHATSSGAESGTVAVAIIKLRLSILSSSSKRLPVAAGYSISIETSPNNPHHLRHARSDRIRPRRHGCVITRPC